MYEVRIVVAIVALLLMGLISGWLGHRRDAGSALLALTSIVWLIGDTFFEGGVLLEVTPRNGLTFADLFGLAGLGVAAVQVAARHRTRRARSEGRRDPERAVAESREDRAQ